VTCGDISKLARDFRSHRIFFKRWPFQQIV